jgi:hypothetical protein
MRAVVGGAAKVVGVVASTSHTSTGHAGASRVASGRGVVGRAVAANPRVGSVGNIAIVRTIVGGLVGVVGSAGVVLSAMGLLVTVMGDSVLNFVDDTRHCDV